MIDCDGWAFDLLVSLFVLLGLLVTVLPRRTKDRAVIAAMVLAVIAGGTGWYGCLVAGFTESLGR